MNKKDLACELANYNRWSIIKIFRAALAVKKYDRLTYTDKTLKEEVEELEEE